MNIVWQQPNSAISVTSIFDGSDPQKHADLLKEQGNIPSDWVAVAYNHVDFPDVIQEAWVWKDNKINADFDVLKAQKLSQYNASAIQVAQARQKGLRRTAARGALPAGPLPPTVSFAMMCHSPSLVA